MLTYCMYLWACVYHSVPVEGGEQFVGTCSLSSMRMPGGGAQVVSPVASAFIWRALSVARMWSSQRDITNTTVQFP